MPFFYDISSCISRGSRRFFFYESFSVSIIHDQIRTRGIILFTLLVFSGGKNYSANSRFRGFHFPLGFPSSLKYSYLTKKKIRWKSTIVVPYSKSPKILFHPKDNLCLGFGSLIFCYCVQTTRNLQI